MKKLAIFFLGIGYHAEGQLAGVDFAAYAEVVFVSKSVGTIIASAYAQKLEEVGMEAALRHILYTPLDMNPV